jgi:hypothetical protein
MYLSSAMRYAYVTRQDKLRHLGSRQGLRPELFDAHTRTGGLWMAEPAMGTGFGLKESGMVGVFCVFAALPPVF